MAVRFQRPTAGMAVVSVPGVDVPPTHTDGGGFGVLPKKGWLGTRPKMRCYCMAKLADYNYGGSLWC